MPANACLRLLAMITFLLIGASIVLARAEPITGSALVTDGDTVVIRGQRIRLEGIDAPETDQICMDSEQRRFACGLQARDALRRFIGDGPITCTGDELDRYGRRLMVCVVGDLEINAAMVESGWALAFVRYSDRYLEQERLARNHSNGLWAGAFIAPWDWRHRGPETVILGSLSVPITAQSVLLPTSPDRPPAEGCPIKGNISRSGERIYHLPGMRDYDQVRINQRAGERWFCTEEEARAAGWRRGHM